MLVSRLMTRGVFVLGALMVVLGLICVDAGVPVVRMEIGWTEVIGGAVAASAGCVVLVMGLLLLQLEALRASFDRSLEAGTSRTVAATEMPGSEPEAASRPPEPPVTRPVHPLSPAARREPPAPITEVRPEPPLAATLHPDDVDEPPPARLPTSVEEPVLTVGAPALVGADDDEAATPPVPAPGRVVDPVAEAAPARERQSFLTSLLSRRSFGAASEILPPVPAKPAPLDPISSMEAAGGVAPQRSPVDLSSGWDEHEPDRAPRLDAPSPADDVYAHGAPARDDAHLFDDQPTQHGERAAPEQEHDPAPEVSPPYSPRVEEPPPPATVSIIPIEPPAPAIDPMQPVVVGRYNAGAASYVMYSNGMIEVETEQGTHQFASMQELKAFIEKRDMRVS